MAADRNSYFFAVSACSRRGEARTAQQLIDEMREAQAGGGPAPDLLLYAVAVKACAGSRSWWQALRLLEEMSVAGGEYFSTNLVLCRLVTRFLFAPSIVEWRNRPTFLLPSRE